MRCLLYLQIKLIKYLNIWAGCLEKFCFFMNVSITRLDFSVFIPADAEFSRVSSWILKGTCCHLDPSYDRFQTFQTYGAHNHGRLVLWAPMFSRNDWWFNQRPEFFRTRYIIFIDWFFGGHLTDCSTSSITSNHGYRVQAQSSPHGQCPPVWEPGFYMMTLTCTRGKIAGMHHVTGNKLL